MALRSGVAFLVLATVLSCALSFRLGSLQNLISCSRDSSLKNLPFTNRTQWENCMGTLEGVQDNTFNPFSGLLANRNAPRKVIAFAINILEKRGFEGNATALSQCLANQYGWTNADNTLNVEAVQADLQTEADKLPADLKENVENGISNCELQDFEIFRYTHCVFKYCVTGRNCTTREAFGQ